jgi:hypothetical protein
MQILDFLKQQFIGFHPAMCLYLFLQKKKKKDTAAIRAKLVRIVFMNRDKGAKGQRNGSCVKYKSLANNREY